MNEQQIKEFEVNPKMNMAVADTNICRFRVNVFKQSGEIPNADCLGLPPILKQVIMRKRSIILLWRHWSR